MSYESEQAGWTQLAWLEEPEAHLTIRVIAVRGDPITPVSFTLTRFDGSWLACECIPASSGPEAVRLAVATMTERGLQALDETIGPF